MTIDWIGLIEYLVRAWLLLYFCKGSIVEKEKYRSTGKILFFLQSFLVNCYLSHSVWVNRVLYRTQTGEIVDSSYSILKLLIVVCCSFAAMNVLYQGRKLAKLYLLLVYYTVQEMCRFILHSVWSLVTIAWLDHLYEQVMEQKIEVEYFVSAAGSLQTYSMWVYTVGYLLFMYLVLRMYRRYLTEPVEEIDRQGLWFLMLTPVISMAFDVLWRISFYRQQGEEIEFFYEKHGSMYVVVPTIAVLCLVCTVFSRKIYGELMASEAQKNSLMFYKQQLADMTAHVRELEQLYDGIRGMRHDVNNCVADMEQLLGESMREGHLPEQILTEAEGYLQHMQQAAERLSLQFSTGNPVIDVILNRKGQICAQEQILLEGEFVYPQQFGIEAFDLGILLNNALDNAIEACRKLTGHQERTIHFRGYCKGRMFFVVVENTYNGEVTAQKEGALRTTKADRKAHGLGMRNMRSCVEKYYGTMQYEAGRMYFTLTIMLQGKSVCNRPKERQRRSL